MEINRKLTTTLILVLGFHVLSFGADTIPFSDPPSLTSSQYYTLTNGLAVNCLGESFIDNNGRMWLNPCREKARELRLSFFQFDGEQSHFYQLTPPWLSEEDLPPIWYIIGETSEGFLFGADIQNRSLFSWHPDTRGQHFFELNPEQKLLNMASDHQGGILILSVENSNEENPGNGTYRINRFFQGDNEIIASIELDFTDDIIHHVPSKSFYPFVATEEAAWFFHQRKGLVKLNLQERTVNFLPWSGFENMPPLLKNYFDQPIVYDVERDEPALFEWRLIDLNEQEMLVYLGMQNGFFTINRQTMQIHPYVALNQQFIKGPDAGERMLNQGVPEGDYGGYMAKVYFARDKKNNLFIASSYYEPWQTITLKDSLEALVIDKEGKCSDYSKVLREMYDVAETKFSRPGTFFSADFGYQLGSTVMDDGLLMVDLQPDLRIIKQPKQRYFEFSGITSLDSTTLFANSNHQVMRLSGWQDPSTAKWDRLTQWWHLAARSRSSIVTKGDRIWMSVVYYTEPRTGLQWYEPATNETDYIPTNVPFEKFVFLNDNEVVLFEDRWDLTDIGAVQILDMESRTTRPFLFRNVPFSIGAKVNDLLFTRDSLLWVAAQNGLWQLDFSNQEVTHFNQSPSLQNSNIICMSPEEDGKLWLGTVHSGIILFDPITQHTQQISEAQGLSNNTVVGILVDDYKNRWVSTFNGISVIDSTGQVLFELKKRDGLQSNWFYSQSFFKLADGKMVFGGAGGLSIFDPNHVMQIIAQRQPNKIYLTGLEYYNKEKEADILLKGTYNQPESIQLTAEHRYLNLDFAISNYVDLSGHSYVYRLIPRGISENEASAVPWINLGSESQVTISNIPAGDYMVQILGRDQYSNKAVVPLEIPIRVHEFFYRKWWFYILASIPFIIGALVWVRRNITEKKRLQSEVDRRTAQIRHDKSVIEKDKLTIEKQASQLQELDHAKSRFFTAISHEFRTPLTVILGLVEQVVDQDRVRKLIKRNARLLLRLVNQILELRKLESGNVSAQLIQGDVTVHVQYVIESFHSLAEDKGVKLMFEGPEEGIVLDYDPEKLLHIISNLLVNAIKFTPEGGTVRILLETQENADMPMYKISVVDTGAGIPKEKLSHIFDRFYQVDDEVSRTGSGTGIGLTLVKELVKILNGEISVESEQGRGTTFTVKLPVTNNADFEEVKHDIINSFELLPEQKSSDAFHLDISENSELPHLLIVEDNADVTEYLATCLKEKYQLIFAHDGQMGIESALEKVPDIIISDVMMPRVDGYELCDFLKTDMRTSHIPIVMLTAKADVDSRITGLQRGADAYLAKPFDPRELHVQLQNLLTLRQQLRERYANLERLEPTEDPAIKQEDTFLLKARQAILEHMEDEEFGVTELCKEMAMSRTQLHNKIKSLTNRSTSHLIRAVRIQQAISLLKDSKLNISQIAAEVGIYSLPYFSKIFAEETGLSPNKYREKIQNEQ